MTSEELLRLAWETLPRAHRQLLERIGADRWKIVDRPLGHVADELARSAGEASAGRAPVAADNDSLGLWIPALRVMLVNDAHPALLHADRSTREALLTWVAWHEWGHALSLTNAECHDRNEGARLLDLAPDGIRERIRRANYRRDEYIHELIAETYALLMRERIEGRAGRPVWLPDEIYKLMMRIGA